MLSERLLSPLSERLLSPLSKPAAPSLPSRLRFNAAPQPHSFCEWMHSFFVLRCGWPGAAGVGMAEQAWERMVEQRYAVMMMIGAALGSDGADDDGLR